MMIIQMDKVLAPSAREQAHCLKKNVASEKRNQRPAQLRVPSDPNAWQQAREKYEALLLEDHNFSEQLGVEYALWQLHYRRIEEFRQHLGAASASKGASTYQNGKCLPLSDRVSKICLQFKTFLSEATGFYHDLIMKIRAQYGLPLGYFSDDSEKQIIMERDEKKSIEMKKGLVSCHRCLIYLGDLARYKGLYGEGDSKSRDFEAALSYYLQAAFLWSPSGNPHHQLALLATYSGDELVTVYRYFRSIAVDTCSSTARENLIVVFEKNRQSYNQLHGDSKAPVANKSRGKRKTDVKYKLKEANFGSNPAMRGTTNIKETYKTFCVLFVRLNGLLFTRTSLETFGEVLALVKSALDELLSFGPEEVLSFGKGITDNGLVIVRLASMLIFSVHNVNREVEAQTYADIVQHTVLLQNALVAVFELMGHILRRCVQLRDPSSSYLLPGILVLLEWVACSPDIAETTNLDDKQATVRSKFWNQCISFLNKLLSDGLVAIDDENETCFSNMSGYKMVETEDCLALWEDFELKGFLPIQPAQAILDFSRRQSFGVDGSKEKLARVKRILAAGKALSNIIRVDQKTMHFHSKLKKFVIGIKPHESDDITLTSRTNSPKSNSGNHEKSIDLTTKMAVMQPSAQLCIGGEEDDEVIVFKPTVNEKRINAFDSKWKPDGRIEVDQNAFEDASLIFLEGVTTPRSVSQHIGMNAGSKSVGDLVPSNLHANDSCPSGLPVNQFPDHVMVTQFVCQKTSVDTSLKLPFSIAKPVPQHRHSYHSCSSVCPVDHETLTNSLKNMYLLENGHTWNSGMQTSASISHTTSLSPSTQLSGNLNINGITYGQAKAIGGAKHLKTDMDISGGATHIQPMVDIVSSSGALLGTLVEKASSAMAASTRESAMNRSLRNLGPPPGFGPIPSIQVDMHTRGSDVMGKTPQTDDYSWLDGYQLPPSVKSSGSKNFVSHSTHPTRLYTGNDNRSVGMIAFPFPGKQVPAVQSKVKMLKGWDSRHNFENLKMYHEQLQQKHLMEGIQEFVPLSVPHKGQSTWDGNKWV